MVICRSYPPCRFRFSAKETVTHFSRLRPAPDGNRKFSLEHHVIGEHGGQLQVGGLSHSQRRGTPGAITRVNFCFIAPSKS